MSHTISFHGSLIQYFQVLHSEYHRLAVLLGQPPFEFTEPNFNILETYIPKNGDEVMIEFWDREHTRTVLAVEAALLPDEDRQEVLIFVHPQGDPFEEPVKPAISIWKEIKRALKKTEKRRVVQKKKRKPQGRTLIALESLREIYSKALKSKRDRPPYQKGCRQNGRYCNKYLA